MLLLATSKGILRLKGGGASLFPAEGLLDEEGRPRYERLLKALREAGAGRGAAEGRAHGCRWPDAAASAATYTTPPAR